ncbi:MAG: hypothetical protein ABMA64_28635 [Myxococcota bacterium]
MTGWLWVSAWAAPPSDDWRPTTPYGHGFVASGWSSGAFDQCLVGAVAAEPPAPADGDEHLFVRAGSRRVDAVVGRGLNLSVAGAEPRWVAWDPCFGAALGPVLGAERVTIEVAIGPVPPTTPTATWRWAGRGHGWVSMPVSDVTAEHFADCMAAHPGEPQGVSMTLPAAGPVLDVVVPGEGAPLAALIVGSVIGPSDGRLRFRTCTEWYKPDLAPPAPPPLAR